MSRLTLDTFDALPEAHRPLLDPRDVSVGVVHLGLGAFTRAHQAVVLERAMAATGTTDWGVMGVSQRSPTASSALAAQDGLYTLTELGDDGPGAVRAVGAIRQTAHAGSDPLGVADRISMPSVRMVTLTVTEKGYCCGAGGWDLDLAHPDIQSDLAGNPPKTVVGTIAAGLARRRSADAPLDVLSCDNLPHNGAVLRRLVTTFLERRGDVATRAWIEGHVRFPNSMVDRMVPASTDTVRKHAHQATSLTDMCAVAGEPFLQWVVEDSFAGITPPLQAGGATITTDVEPWERLKLRVLNATHSLLAWHGLLRGHDEIAAAVRDPELHSLTESLAVVDMAPGLSPPPGITVPAYLEQVLRRCENRGLHHQTRQVASDGTAKLGPRFLEPALQALASGRTPDIIASAIAAWWHLTTRGTDLTGRPITINDPKAQQILADRPSLDVALQRLAPPFEGHPEFVRAVESHADRIGRAAT